MGTISVSEGGKITLVIVNPFHVKCTRELDDNSQTKNDRKDSKTIAMLVKDGRFREVYIPEDVYWIWLLEENDQNRGSYTTQTEEVSIVQTLIRICSEGMK